MFTVVITEQTHLDSIHEYSSFLKPFLNHPQIAFCRWQPDGRDLDEAVPELVNTVARHERWRLIVVCDEEGLEQKNPFDLSAFEMPTWEKGMDQSEFTRLRLEAKRQAFSRAARKPLTRLMTWLCQAPLVTELNFDAHKVDPEFAAYVEEFRVKEELRRQILGDYVPQIALPAEIICVAKRCYTQSEYDIRNAWNLRPDCQYSRFYDWNLYFDRMRYLVFDILPKAHRNYTFDYIRFLYALMLLARHETPMAVLSPNRVYNLDCRNDEQALCALLTDYDSRLAATEDVIRGKINRLRNGPKPRLSDRDAEMIFCAPVTVPVIPTSDFDQSSLYISKDGLGLSTDCPCDEENAWDKDYQTSRRSLIKYLRLPRRALKKTVTDMHRLKTADLDAASRLNEFQLEDVAENVAEEELRMVSVKVPDLYNTDAYTRRTEKQSKKVRRVIATRMTKKRTLILGALALLCVLLGMMPMFFTNGTSGDNLKWSLIFTLCGLGVMALVSIGILWFLRRPLRKGYNDYNGVMKGIVNEVEDSMGVYSTYVSHACNVMRGNSVLNYRTENESPEDRDVRILKKHICDLERTRQELREVFGIFLPEKTVPADAEQAYPFDFLRPVDYDYPMPYTDETSGVIEFLQKGNDVEVPVNFVRSLQVRREDLYD